MQNGIDLIPFSCVLSKCRMLRCGPDGVRAIHGDSIQEFREGIGIGLRRIRGVCCNRAMHYDFVGRCRGPLQQNSQSKTQEFFHKIVAAISARISARRVFQRFYPAIRFVIE